MKGSGNKECKCKCQVSYQWPRKVKAKTVSVALSQEQYEALKEAIDTWHQTQEILQRMQALSRHVIFEMLPNPPRAYSGGCRTLIPISVGQRSDFCRTLFRFISDSVPG